MRSVMSVRPSERLFLLCLISTWLIVATACMRYVATFHPLQNHLDSL